MVVARGDCIGHFAAAARDFRRRPSISSLFCPSFPSIVVRVLPSSKGWTSPSRDLSLVSRPGSRTGLVSHWVQQDGSMRPAFGPPYRVFVLGLARGAKDGAFPIFYFLE